jgi:hypothetical protein
MARDPDSTIITGTGCDMAYEFGGPFEVWENEETGAVYMPVRSTAGGFAMYKADWYDETWSEQDASNAPTGSTLTSTGTSSLFDGRYIHIMFYAGGSDPYYHYYSQFDCFTDTWVKTDVQCASLASANYVVGPPLVTSGSDIYTFFTEPEPKKYNSMPVYSYSTNFGTSFTQNVDIPDSDSKAQEDVQASGIAANDDLIFIWNSHGDSPNHVLYTVSYDGSSFSDLHTPSSSLYSWLMEGACRFTSSGSDVFVFRGREDVAGTIDLEVVEMWYHNDGNSISFDYRSLVAVSTDFYAQYGASPVIDTGEELIIFTSRYPTTGIWYATRDYGSTSWSELTKLDDEVSYSDGMVGRRCNADGYAAVVWVVTNTGVYLKCYPSVPDKFPAGTLQRKAYFF